MAFIKVRLHIFDFIAHTHGHTQTPYRQRTWHHSPMQIDERKRKTYSPELLFIWLNTEEYIHTKLDFVGVV